MERWEEVVWKKPLSEEFTWTKPNFIVGIILFVIVLIIIWLKLLQLRLVPINDCLSQKKHMTRTPAGSSTLNGVR